MQELATSSTTSARSQRKRDRQVAQLHAALVTIHDGLEQTVSKTKTKGTAGSKYVQQRLATESKRSRFEHGCSTQVSALDGAMDYVSKDISTSDPSELQTPICGRENRRPRVDQRKTSIADQEDLIMKQLLDEPIQSKMSAVDGKSARKPQESLVPGPGTHEPRSQQCHDCAEGPCPQTRTCTSSWGLPPRP